MNRYIPPDFPLYEFEPGDADDGEARRWLVHWDGPIGSPASDVVLGWTRGSANVWVCTTDRKLDPAYARFRAAHLVFGGTFLPAGERPVGATRIGRAMERVRDDDEAWSPIGGLVSGATASEAAQWDGYAVAYTLFAGGAVIVLASGVPVADFRVRAA